MDTNLAIQAKNISKTFNITEDSHNTVKQVLADGPTPYPSIYCIMMRSGCV